MKKILLLLLINVNITACQLMPYKRDFDCPIPMELKCKSLYEVNKMADQGAFDPNNVDKLTDKLHRCCNKHNRVINEHP